MSVASRLLRSRFRAVSWRHPVVAAILRILDPFDLLVRSARGLSYLPPYSVRVRSNGVGRQWGGRRFVQQARLLASLIQELADVRAGSRVLEIGCGCGRVALGLVERVPGVRYVGADVDPVALAAAAGNRRLRESDCRFQHIDVANTQYNPEGASSGTEFSFPFPDGSFDVVALVSVFTHMLRDEMSRYADQIARLLAPHGRCFLTVFLMDHGTVGRDLVFGFEHDGCRIVQPSLPEKAVGYPLEVLDAAFENHGMRRPRAPTLGTWRAGQEPDESRFAQDVLIYEK